MALYTQNIYITTILIAINKNKLTYLVGGAHYSPVSSIIFGKSDLSWVGRREVAEVTQGAR